MTALTVVTDQYQQDVARAQAISDRIKSITGCQCGEDDCWQCRVWCWMCRTDMNPSDVQPHGLLFTCKDQDECKRRAAEFAEAEDAERFYEAAPEYEDEEFAYQAAQGRGDCGGMA